MSSNTVVRATKSVNTLQAPVVVRGPSTVKQSSSVVKQSGTVVKKSSGPVVKKATTTASTGHSSSTVKKPSTEKKATPVAKKPKVAKEEDDVGDVCDSHEDRSSDGSDDGADLSGFVIDEEDESDGVSEEEEAAAIEKDSFKSVDDYKSQMEEIKAMLGSKRTRSEYMQKHTK